MRYRDRTIVNVATDVGLATVVTVKGQQDSVWCAEFTVGQPDEVEQHLHQVSPVVRDGALAALFGLQQVRSA